MNFADIKKFDVANGPGVRVSLFVSGCHHGCKNCFNKEAWDFNYGNLFTKEKEDEIISLLNNSPNIYSGITVLGGEPFAKENIKTVLDFIHRVKKEVTIPSFTIWVYTGSVLDQLVDEDIIPEGYDLFDIDAIVDGPFYESLKDLKLKFRGSSNQRILNRENIKKIWENRKRRI